MKLKTTLWTSVALVLAAGTAGAEGKLNIYNWTDYTSPEVIAKFEKETGIDVTLDTYDTNETLLAKLQAGATGYDIIVPTSNFVPIFISEGLVQEFDASELPNFENVAERWREVDWDPGRKYSVPFTWGSASIAYRPDLLGKTLDTYAEFFEPPEELRGRISVFKSPEEIVNQAHLYLGQPFCSEDPAQMQKVQDLLLAQKPYVLAYSSEGMNDRLINDDVIISDHWNGVCVQGPGAGRGAGQGTRLCLSQGGCHRLGGQSDDSGFGGERGECQGLHELHDGPREHGYPVDLHGLWRTDQGTG